jgi:hypothetical protein
MIELLLILMIAEIVRKTNNFTEVSTLGQFIYEGSMVFLTIMFCVKLVDFIIKIAHLLVIHGIIK